MQDPSCLPKTCRHCRFYTPEGRRGGQCGRLTAPVLSHWQACSLALPPFAPSWEIATTMIALSKVSPVPHNEIRKTAREVEPANLPELSA